MSYEFTPLSDDELDNILPAGEYHFEVVQSERKKSQVGNPMAQLQLKVWDDNGKQTTLFDYLVFSKVNLNIKKVSHFSKATGLHEEYKKGMLPEELSGLKGNVEIGIQEKEPKPQGGFYPKKNVVIDYIEPTSVDLIDDDIPL